MPTRRQPADSATKLLGTRRITLILIVLLMSSVYVVVPQLDVFSTSWNTLAHANPGYVSLAILCLLLSFAAATSMYLLLSARKLRFGATYLVQIAGAFAGKVLPIGLGSISVSYLYLRKQRHSQAVAATIVTVNNLLGFVGHMLWLVILAGLFSTQVHALNTKNFPSHTVVFILAGVGVAIVAVMFLARKRLASVLAKVMSQLGSYRRKPIKLVVALLASMALTASNIAIVWLSALALHIPFGVVAAAIALTAGVIAQSATPTPGGLGGVEAGLVGGLVLGGMPLHDAVAVTILFRCITFWLPLVLGGLALFAVLRKKLL